MGNNRSNTNERGVYLAGELADSLLKIALEQRNLAHKHIEEVYKSVDKDYHKSIRILPQRHKIYDREFILNEDQRAKGLMSYFGKTYVEIFRPYVDVEGRITQMIDVHKNHKAPYQFDTYAEQIGDYWVMTCYFEGLNKHGQPFKTKERSIINFKGNGVDSTNPIENASTSAVGRALSHGGYGNIGSGLSSFEDIYTAKQAMEELQGKKPPKSNEGDQGSKNNNPSTYNEDPRDNSESGPNYFSDERNSTSREHESMQSRENSREKNTIVGRLMALTNDWSNEDLKSIVSQWLKFNWNGRFNSLDVGQLRLVEEHLKARNRGNSQAM